MGRKRLKWLHQEKYVQAECRISGNFMHVQSIFSVSPSSPTYIWPKAEQHSVHSVLCFSGSSFFKWCIFKSPQITGQTQMMLYYFFPVWKLHNINSNQQCCHEFLGGNNRDSETAFVTHSVVISWVSPCVFTTLLGPTLINANHKQISLALTHHLSPSSLTTQVSSPSHAHQRHPTWKPFIRHPCRYTVCVWK